MTVAASSLAELKLERLRKLRGLYDELKQAELDEANMGKSTWSEIARPEQLPPPGAWYCWLIMAGRRAPR